LLVSVEELELITKLVPAVIVPSSGTPTVPAVPQFQITIDCGSEGVALFETVTVAALGVADP
jgi:hypothetical protein